MMDLVEGNDLAHQPSATNEHALRWVAEAADAIEYAHGMGVVHCDLKPSNLLLGGDDHVRVTDFGLARSLETGAAAHGGTQGFMAPEQTDIARTVSPRTDVYGLGAVLCALLPVRSPGVDAICQRCLAPEPRARYATAAELASALRERLVELSPTSRNG